MSLVLGKDSVRGVLTILLIVLLGVGSGIGIYEYIRSKTLDKNVAQLKEDVAGLKDQAKVDAVQLAANSKELADGKKERETLASENTQLHSQNATVIAERDEYKRQLKMMTDIQIAEEMGKRIGAEEVGVVVSGNFRFSLTRVGGEKTVAIFKDAEVYFTLSQNQSKEIGNLNITVKSLESSLKTEENSTAIEHEGRVRAEFTLDKAMKDVTTLVGQKKLNRWMGRLEGVGVAVLTFLLIKGVSK